MPDMDSKRSTGVIYIKKALSRRRGLERAVGCAPLRGLWGYCSWVSFLGGLSCREEGPASLMVGPASFLTLIAVGVLMFGSDNLQLNLAQI